MPLWMYTSVAPILTRWPALLGLPSAPGSNDLLQGSSLGLEVRRAVDAHVLARGACAFELRQSGGDLAAGVKHEADEVLCRRVDAHDVAFEDKCRATPFDALGDSFVCRQDGLADAEHQRRLLPLAYPKVHFRGRLRASAT